MEMLSTKRVHCDNYETIISQFQTDPLFLFPIILRLGLCKMPFFFPSQFPGCQVLTKVTQDGNWKAWWGRKRLPRAITCHSCRCWVSTGPGGRQSPAFCSSSFLRFVYLAFPEAVSQSSSEVVTPAKQHSLQRSMSQLLECCSPSSWGTIWTAAPPEKPGSQTHRAYS